MKKTLKAEIWQHNPFASASEEAFVNIRRTSAALNGEVEAILKLFGLTSTQWPACFGCGNAAIPGTHHIAGRGKRQWFYIGIHSTNPLDITVPPRWGMSWVARG